MSALTGHRRHFYIIGEVSEVPEVLEVAAVVQVPGATQGSCYRPFRWLRRLSLIKYLFLLPSALSFKLVTFVFEQDIKRSETAIDAGDVLLKVNLFFIG